MKSEGLTSTSNKTLPLGNAINKNRKKAKIEQHTRTLISSTRRFTFNINEYHLI